MSSTVLDFEKVKAAAVADIKLSLEEAFRPALTRMLQEKLLEAIHAPYQLSVGSNVTTGLAMTSTTTDADVDRAFHCKHGNIVLESDDCPQCVQEIKW